MPIEVDALLRRVERTAVVVSLVFTGVALLVTRGRLLPAVGVAGGALLALVSYRMIVSSAGGLAEALAPADPRERRSPAGAAVRMAGRYALLALLAYVMIARLRLPPLGLLAGASSVVAAVALEAVRVLSTKRP